MRIFPAIFLISLAPIAWGQDFESVVNFSTELSSLDDPAEVEAAVRDGRIVILEGLLGDTVVEKNPTETRVWVTLVGGSWVGTDEVRSYSCRILFEGDRWLDVFPGNKPREPSEVYVPQGSRLLVAAVLIGVDEESGVPTAKMVAYRVLH